MIRKQKCKCKKNIKEKHIAAIAAALCGCMLLFSGCGSKEEEIPMGRYADREVKLPAGTFEYMHSCPDGGYYLYGTDTNLTYVDAQGASKEKVFSWENNANIHVKFEVGVSDSGEAVFAYSPKFYTDEEDKALAMEGVRRWLYYYVDEGGQKHELTLYGENYPKGTSLSTFAFSPEGELYAASENNMYRINVGTGETDNLFPTAGQVKSIVFVDDVMLAIDAQKAYLYDMAGKKLLDDNSILNEFVASHNNGGIVMDVSDKDINVTAMSENADSAGTEDAVDTAETENSIASSDGAMNITGSEDTAEGAGTDESSGTQILYLACRTGVYRYIWGGSVIEQIADGQMVALSDTQRNPLGLQVLDNGEFRVLFSGNYMVEMYYDETLPARPSRELAVYSLEENGWIRYAGQLFQKEHPDVLVRYETGMDGDSAVSKEDALKNLNTRLLAGEVPDVIILDNMDIEQYAEKGVLKELDGIVEPYLEEGVLYQNIVEGMRMTEEDKIYSVPMMVYLPLWLSEKMYLEGEDSLEDIVAGVEMAREKHPEGPILYTPYPRDLLRQTLPVCLPAWTKEDGSLDVEKLTEYYQGVSRMWELDSVGLPGAERETWQKNNTEYYEPRDIDMVDIAFNGQYTRFQNFGETWLQLGFLTSSYYGIELRLRPVEINLAADWQTKELEDEAGFGKYIGQADNVYWARIIVGLCEQAKEPELAEEYMNLLLSDNMMRKWWLESPSAYGGITIRKDSFRDLLDINNVEYGEVMGWKDPAFMNVENVWTPEEEKEWFYQMMEDADTCYRPGTMLEECALEVGLRVLEGELTPEEGAKEVARKMAISMEE